MSVLQHLSAEVFSLVAKLLQIDSRLADFLEKRMTSGLFYSLFGAWLLIGLPSIYLLAHSRVSRPWPAIAFGSLAAVVVPPIGLIFILALTLIPSVDNAS